MNYDVSCAISGNSIGQRGSCRWQSFIGVLALDLKAEDVLGLEK
jgi:hypothetical protein